MGDGFYRSKDAINSIKVLKEKLQGKTQTTQKYKIVHTKRYEYNNTASPLVYSNMGRLGDGSHRGQVCQA